MANWERTIKVVKGRLEDQIEDGMFKGRRVITRDSPIDGGVSLGAYEREAIVVDSKAYPELRRLYNLATEKAKTNGQVKATNILGAVYETVTDAFPIREEAKVQEIFYSLGGRADSKITLDCFIKAGTGVCRHMALTAGALLELFKADGYIRGKISIDRNETSLGAHEWVRYTNSEGRVIILDPANECLGFLDDEKIKLLWDYSRPEDNNPGRKK